MGVESPDGEAEDEVSIMKFFTFEIPQTFIAMKNLHILAILAEWTTPNPGVYDTIVIPLEAPQTSNNM